MTERTMTKADLVTSLILVVFGAAVVAGSLAMPDMTGRNESPYSNPGVVSGFIGTMIFLLSGGMLIRSIKRGAVKTFAEDRNKGGDVDRVRWIRIAKTIGLCVLYAFFLGKVWFPLLTFLFVFSFVIWFEYDFKEPVGSQWKKFLFAFILAGSTSAAVTLVFERLFLVRLP